MNVVACTSAIESRIKVNQECHNKSWHWQSSAEATAAPTSGPENEARAHIHVPLIESY
jgi:hypothetical protein